MGLLLEQFGHSWWFYGQVAFTLAMIVHVYRTKPGELWYVWYLVILFAQPIGPWIYFLAIVVGSIRVGNPWESLWRRRLTLDELRYHAERMPTVNNRLALAEGLMAKGEHAEALPILEAVLAADQIHCQAMHDLALCHLACDSPARAVKMLERLLARDYRWSYYRAWRTLIDAQTASEKPAEALKACRELAKMVPTLENKCLLAEHLLENKLGPEAVEILDQALEDHAYTPLGKRLKNWRWARCAQQLLREAQG